MNFDLEDGEIDESGDEGLLKITNENNPLARSPSVHVQNRNGYDNSDISNPYHVENSDFNIRSAESTTTTIAPCKTVSNMTCCTTTTTTTSSSCVYTKKPFDNMMSVPQSSHIHYQNNKIDDELTDEIDETDDEMICVRGASPSRKRLKLDISKYYDNDDLGANRNHRHRHHHHHHRRHHRDHYNHRENNDDGNNESDNGCMNSPKQYSKRNEKCSQKYSKKSSKRTRREEEKEKSKRHRSRHTKDDLITSSSNKDCNLENQNNTEYLTEKKTSKTLTLTHDENRKLEICKFYLMDCCVKPNNCDYMHSDFPCKFYYLGMECKNREPCKFMHGKALSEEMKSALLRHIVAAPRTILGTIFKRLTREEAEFMLDIRNTELLKNEIETNSQVAEVNCEMDKEVDNNNKEMTLKTKSQLKNEKNSKINSKDDDDRKNFINFLSLIWNSIESSIEILKEAKQSSKTDETDSTKESNKSQENSVLLNNLKLPSGISEYLTKNNITNLDKLKQLPLSLLEEMSNLKKKMNDSDNGIQGKPKSNKRASKQDDDLTNDDDDQNEVEQMNKEKECTEKVLPLEINSNSTKKNLLVVDESVDFEVESNDNNDSNDEEGNLVIDESKIFDKEEAALMDEICMDMQNDITIRSPDEINDNNSGNNVNMDISPINEIREYSPTVEIKAAINSFYPIKYELKKIDLSKKKKWNLSDGIPPEKILDPRIRKILNLPNLNYDSNNNHNEINSSNATTIPAASTVRKEMKDSDPRKKRYQNRQQSMHYQNLENFLSVLEKYLKNSKWYNELNSYETIHVRQQLDLLTNELKNFYSQSKSTPVKFSLQNIQNGNEIGGILNRLKIYIDPYGNIKEKLDCETNTASNGELVSTSNDDDINKQDKNNKNIPSLLSLRFNDNLLFTNDGYNSPNTQNIIPQWNNNQLQQPRPGLLGIAPGIPQFPSIPSHFHGSSGNLYQTNYFFGNNYPQLPQPSLPPLPPPIQMPPPPTSLLPSDGMSHSSLYEMAPNKPFYQQNERINLYRGSNEHNFNTSRNLKRKI